VDASHGPIGLLAATNSDLGQQHLSPVELIVVGVFIVVISLVGLLTLLRAQEGTRQNPSFEVKAFRVIIGSSAVIVGAVICLVGIIRLI